MSLRAPPAALAISVRRSRASVAAPSILLVVLVGSLVGCGDGATKTVTTPTRTVTVPAKTATTPPAESASHPNERASTPPSAQAAERYAQRTYVIQPQLGKRVFKLDGSAVTATAADGSLISAFDIVIADSGDGTGHAVLFFRGDEFLGWASDRLAVHLSVSTSGSEIAVEYGDFRGDDPLCCPSSTKTVHYSWNGARIIGDDDPPLAYGKPGDQLHLAPSG